MFIIENVDLLIVDGESTFGNGVELDIVNEGGGRTLTMFDKLSANLAYFLVFYRHNKPFIKALEKIIDDYVSGIKSAAGTIKAGAKISNCKSIVNVNIGTDAVVTGASNLKNGTIVSCHENYPAFSEMMFRQKILLLSGAKVDDAVILQNSFIGQGVKMGKQYSAENSAFFANSEAFHGESCSIFSRPLRYTSQIFSFDSRLLFILQRRQRYKPEQSHVQTRAT